LRNVGKAVGRGNSSELDDFNKIQFFRTCLRNPQVAMRGYHVGGLSLTPRFMTFIVIWLLTPRVSTIWF